jgi:hypothetical protein
VVAFEPDFRLLERAGTRATLDETGEMDEQQRCWGGRWDRCICPVERKTARRHDPPVSLAEVEQSVTKCLQGPGRGAVRKRSRADGLGAGGAQSISGSPGRRGAPFAKSNRQKRGDRTSALPIGHPGCCLDRRRERALLCLPPGCGGPIVDQPLSAVVRCRKRQQDVAPC